jgi:1-deoxy-D-xylulose-5-phosphate reductoisomerase
VKKKIAILGSTGSIGTQALDIIRSFPEHFSTEILCAGSNATLLIQQAIEFSPNAVVIADETKYPEVKSSLEKYDIKVFSGDNSIEQIVESENIDLVLAAMVGFSGLRPTLNAIRHKKNIALANKETLVVAGDIITKTAYENGVSIFPVDSEHSAIFQCLAGEVNNKIEKLILTASGGPFRGKKLHELKNITPEDALSHPVWQMGKKVTIDSATLMNKGLEVIEAHWLFNTNPGQIEVLIHPQSIIHSMVQFADGSIKAQLSIPDMRLPISYAFGYPQRLQTEISRIDWNIIKNFTFEKPDTQTFRNLSLAYNALEKGGNTACIMNAANEIAVNAFLNKQIRFTDIPEIIETAMQRGYYISAPTLEDYFNSDNETRKNTEELIKKINK